MTRRTSGIKREWILTGVFVLTLFAVGINSIPRYAGYAYEDIRFAVNPTAEHAYTIAIKHLDARSPEEYDIRRAGKYLDKTQQIDTVYPHIHHHLARLYFLRGQFEQALSHINTELLITAEPMPSSYYVKGLIEGFMGSYQNAALSYEQFLKSDPNNWAGLNDYAWVLLRGNRPHEALTVLNRALETHPKNPWLLNSKTTALFELKRYPEALEVAALAKEESLKMNEETWWAAYPGNDPNTTAAGILTLQNAARFNFEKIEIYIASSSHE